MAVPSRSVTVIGAGAVGLRLAQRWQIGGVSVRVHARSAASRQRSQALGLRFEPRLELALQDSEGLILCVPDPEIERASHAVARALATLSAPNLRFALHTAGSRGPSVLAALARSGLAVGQLHPLAAFMPAGAGPDLQRAWCAIAGEPMAREAAVELCRLLGARPLALRDVAGASVRYHAAAALLSNGSVALTAAAFEIANSACADPGEAREAFLALLETTLANLRRESPERALSGPIARGDAATIRAHLRALEGDARPEAAYRALSALMIELAQRDGRLGEGAARELRGLVGGA